MARKQTQEEYMSQIRRMEGRVSERSMDRMIAGILRNHWRDYGMARTNVLIDEMGLDHPHFDEEPPKMDDSSVSGMIRSR